jgi:hypothetical protein
MRDLALLHPQLVELYVDFAQEMYNADLPFIVTCTLRTHEEHAALWAQGRFPLDSVNDLRRMVRWAPITSYENRKKVTWTEKTLHFPDENGFSKAFDIALKMPGSSRVHWDGKISVNRNQIPDYQEAAEIGRIIGLKPGYDFKDPCHFQMK